MKAVERDLTEMEVQDLLREIRRTGKGKAKADKSTKVDELMLQGFLAGKSKAAKKASSRDLIVDIQVGRDPAHFKVAPCDHTLNLATRLATRSPSTLAC